MPFSHDSTFKPSLDGGSEIPFPLPKTFCFLCNKETSLLWTLHCIRKPACFGYFIARGDHLPWTLHWSFCCHHSYFSDSWMHLDEEVFPADNSQISRKTCLRANSGSKPSFPNITFKKKKPLYLIHNKLKKYFIICFSSFYIFNCLFYSNKTLPNSRVLESPRNDASFCTLGL